MTVSPVREEVNSKYRPRRACDYVVLRKANNVGYLRKENEHWTPLCTVTVYEGKTNYQQVILVIILG